MITANVNSSTIQATVSGSQVTASVAASPVTASASGGIGPVGAADLADMGDVQLSGVTDGDVLAYAADAGRWVNQDALDGGNW